MRRVYVEGSQDHPEGAGATIAVQVAMVACSAQHRPVDDGQRLTRTERRRSCNADLLAGEGIPHNNLGRLRVAEDEGAAMSAVEELEAVAMAGPQGEAGRRDPVRRVKRGDEEDGFVGGEEAEERGPAVVGAEAA